MNPGSEDSEVRTISWPIVVAFGGVPDSGMVRHAIGTGTRRSCSDLAGSLMQYEGKVTHGKDLEYQ
jgi:hypothetical protein